MNRIIAAAAAVGISLATIAIAPGAEALGSDGPCAFKLAPSSIPSRYVIGKQKPIVRLADSAFVGNTMSCTLADEWEADFVARGPNHKGRADLYFAGCSYDWVDTYTGKCMDWNYNTGEYKENFRYKLDLERVGTWTLRSEFLDAADWPGDDYDTYNPKFPQGQQTIVAKLGSKTRLYAYRLRGVRIDVWANHWSTTPWPGTWVHSPGAVVQIQEKARHGWRTIRTVRTKKYGFREVVIQRARKHTYRAVTIETPTRWSSHSRPGSV